MPHNREPFELRFPGSSYSDDSNKVPAKTLDLENELVSQPYELPQEEKLGHSKKTYQSLTSWADKLTKWRKILSQLLRSFAGAVTIQEHLDSRSALFDDETEAQNKPTLKIQNIPVVPDGIWQAPQGKRQQSGGGAKKNKSNKKEREDDELLEQASRQAEIARQEAAASDTRLALPRNYERIRISGEQNNCFFNALSAAGVDLDRYSAIQILLEALDTPAYHEAIQEEVRQSIEAGEYIPTPGMVGTAQLRDFLLYLGAPQNEHGFHMVAFTTHTLGIIDILADIFQIQIEIVTNPSKNTAEILRTTIPLTTIAPRLTVTLLYSPTTQHFDLLRNRERELQAELASIAPLDGSDLDLSSSKAIYLPLDQRDKLLDKVDVLAGLLIRSLEYYHQLIPKENPDKLEERITLIKKWFKTFSEMITHGKLIVSETDNLYIEMQNLRLVAVDGRLPLERFSIVQAIQFFETEFFVSEWLRKDYSRISDSFGATMQDSATFLRWAQDNQNRRELSRFLQPELEMLEALKIASSSQENSKTYEEAMCLVMQRLKAMKAVYERQPAVRTQEPDLLIQEHRSFFEKQQRLNTEATNRRNAEIARMEAEARAEAEVEAKAEAQQEGLMLRKREKEAAKAERKKHLEELKGEAAIEEENKRIIKEAVKYRAALAQRKLQSEKESFVAQLPFFNHELLEAGQPDYKAIHREIERIGGSVALNPLGNNQNVLTWERAGGRTEGLTAPLLEVYFYHPLHGAQLLKGSKAGAFVGLRERLRESGRLEEAKH